MNNFFHFLTVIKPSKENNSIEQYWCSCGGWYINDYDIWKHIKEANNER